MFAWWQSLLHHIRSLFPGRSAAVDGPDDEIRAVFLEELAEVEKALRAASQDWRLRPTDTEVLKRLRRGFHTIKGSAPLVGATALSETAGQVEHLLLRLIEKPAAPKPEWRDLVEQAIQLLPACAESIRKASAAPRQLRALGAQAQRWLA